MRLWAFQIDSGITLGFRLLVYLLGLLALRSAPSYKPFHGLQKDVKKKEGEEDATKTETSLSLCKQYAMLFASDTPHLR